MTVVRISTLFILVFYNKIIIGEQAALTNSQNACPQVLGQQQQFTKNVAQIMSPFPPCNTGQQSYNPQPQNVQSQLNLQPSNGQQQGVQMNMQQPNVQPSPNQVSYGFQVPSNFRASFQPASQQHVINFQQQSNPAASPANTNPQQPMRVVNVQLVNPQKGQSFSPTAAQGAPVSNPSMQPISFSVAPASGPCSQNYAQSPTSASLSPSYALSASSPNAQIKSPQQNLVIDAGMLANLASSVQSQTGAPISSLPTMVTITTQPLSSAQPSGYQYNPFEAPAVYSETQTTKKGSKSSLKSILPYLFNMLQERMSGCGCPNCRCRCMNNENNGGQTQVTPQVYDTFENQGDTGKPLTEASLNELPAAESSDDAGGVRKYRDMNEDSEQVEAEDEEDDEDFEDTEE